jgi:hypothetical protein
VNSRFPRPMRGRVVVFLNWKLVNPRRTLSVASRPNTTAVLPAWPTCGGEQPQHWRRAGRRQEERYRCWRQRAPAAICRCNTTAKARRTPQRSRRVGLACLDGQQGERWRWSPGGALQVAAVAGLTTPWFGRQAQRFHGIVRQGVVALGQQRATGVIGRRGTFSPVRQRGRTASGDTVDWSGVCPSVRGSEGAERGPRPTTSAEQFLSLSARRRRRTAGQRRRPGRSLRCRHGCDQRGKR